jgi:hypothetical protein
MTDLMNVLAPPKKAKAPTDPNQKILKSLARAGWTMDKRGVKELIVRQYDEEVFITNTYMMRRFERYDDVSHAIRSIIPDTENVEEVMSAGFTMFLSAGKGGEWNPGGRNGTDMKNVWPSDIPSDEIVSWEPNEDDSSQVFGFTDDGIRVLLTAKNLKACVEGIDKPRVWVTVSHDDWGDGVIPQVRKPVVITGEYVAGVGGLLHSILMPVRIA